MFRGQANAQRRRGGLDIIGECRAVRRRATMWRIAPPPPPAPRQNSTTRDTNLIAPTTHLPTSRIRSHYGSEFYRKRAMRALLNTAFAALPARAGVSQAA